MKTEEIKPVGILYDKDRKMLLKVARVDDDGVVKYSACSEFVFPHGKILQIENTSPNFLIDYAFVVVKRYFPIERQLECYAVYVHEESGLDKIYVADEHVKDAYSMPSKAFENHISNHILIDMNQGWKIKGGVMAFDEMIKLFQLVESIGYRFLYTITADPTFRHSCCAHVPVNDACVYGLPERIKKKNYRHGKRKKH